MSEASVEDPLLGKVLSGRFQIVEALGVGGMGRVYKAIQQPLDRVVALKVLNPRYDSRRDPGFERRFFLEASMTARLKHPNTITVHDYGRTDEGIYFIAMEYLEGETLQQLLAREGPLPWSRALAIGAQVARSLREAHRLGLVHRDLKPANVMLLADATGGDVVKVLDFGLVKAFASDVIEPSDTELTQAGVLLGSPLYMAPEQAKAQTDQRTDIYSLGVLLFQCIAGRPPFQGKEAIDIIVKHVKEKPPELRALRPDVPPEVHTLVMRCLEKAPAERFQTMDELLEAMREALSGQGMSGLFVDPRTSSNPYVPTHTSQATRAPSSTRVRMVSPVEGPASPARAEASGVHHSLEVEITESGTHPGKQSRRQLGFVVWGLTVLGLAAGGFIAWTKAARPLPGPAVTASPQPEPSGPVEPPAPAAPAAPAPAASVTFTVDSEPRGATVTRSGAVIGITPFSFTMERTSDAPANVELVFALEGYLSTTMVAEGLSGVVAIRPSLTKKRDAAAPAPLRPRTKSTPKPPTDPDPGYKDDPYQ